MFSQKNVGENSGILWLCCAIIYGENTSTPNTRMVHPLTNCLGPTNFKKRLFLLYLVSVSKYLNSIIKKYGLFFNQISGVLSICRSLTSVTCSWDLQGWLAWETEPVGKIFPSVPLGVPRVLPNTFGSVTGNRSPLSITA